MLRESMKRYALKHTGLLLAYRHSFGKLKTKYLFNMRRKALQKEGYDLIKKLDAALCATNARYFVNCGTLLGMFRDGRLIPYDMDMDFGIWFDSDFGADELDQVMNRLGYKKIKAFFFHGEVKEITYAKGVLHIDFFVLDDSKTETRFYVFYRDLKKKYPDSSYYSVIMQRGAHITGLKRFYVNGIEMNIPENTEEYLASGYTENWRIPNANWSYTMSPSCNFVAGEYGIRQLF